MKIQKKDLNLTKYSGHFNVLKNTQKKIIDLFKNNKNYYLKEITKEFENLIGFKVKDLIFKNIHGWRYAYNFQNKNLNCFWSNKKNLGICADWMAGPKAENAWLSANYLYKKIKKNPPKKTG